MTAYSHVRLFAFFFAGGGGGACQEQQLASAVPHMWRSCCIIREPGNGIAQLYLECISTTHVNQTKPARSLQAKCTHQIGARYSACVQLHSGQL